MSTIDFTDKTFESIKNKNKKNYKKKETALLNHFCNQVKNLIGSINPRCILQAYGWLWKTLNEMKDDRKDKKSRLKEELENITKNTPSEVEDLETVTLKLNGGIGSVWSDDVAKKMKVAMNTLKKTRKELWSIIEHGIAPSRKIYNKPIVLSGSSRYAKLQWLAAQCNKTEKDLTDKILENNKTYVVVINPNIELKSEREETDKINEKHVCTLESLK